MKQVAVDASLTIAYKEQGSGVPIVLLHGNCGSSGYFDRVAPLLAAKHRVIAPDLRGHGGSSAPEGVYAMETLAEDVRVLLDKLELERVYLFGHSLGGYVALAFAEKYGERLKGFGLLHSTAYPDDEAARAGRDRTVRRLSEEGIAPYIDELVPKLFAPEHRQTMPEAVEHAKRIGYGTSVRGAIGVALGMKERPDRRHVLASAGVPALLLAGKQDGIVAPERRFPVRGPRIAAVELDGCGHMGMLEAPEPFARAVADFVAACEQGGRFRV